MENYREHKDKTNYTDVFLRNAIIGLLGYFRNRFKWVNTSKELGDVIVDIPIHYSLTGQSRMLMDMFYDDIPQNRVNMNTDKIPRGRLSLQSWAIKSEEFSNPNVWFNVNALDQDDELITIATQTKAVPLKLVFEFETIFDNEIDIFKCWQIYMSIMWNYKYFTFEFNNIPINAIFNYMGDVENTVARDYTFEKSESFKTVYTFEVHTFLPLFDIINEDSINNLKINTNDVNAGANDGINGNVNNTNYILNNNLVYFYSNIYTDTDDIN